MTSPTHIYFQTNDTFSPFLWFQSNKANEMLLGIYGLKGKNAKLRYIYPEHEILSSELSQIHYKYKDATEVNKPVDYITCHADGRFHIETKNSEELYIQKVQRTKPLGAETSVFLDCVVVSDVIGEYSPITGKPKEPYCFLRASPDHLFSFRCLFSGANYSLENEVSKIMSDLTENDNLEKPAIVLNFGSFKGIIWGHTLKPDNDLQKRQRGTIVSFKFPVEEEKMHLKAFLFE